MMTIINKFSCQVALFCAGLAIIPACSNNSNKQEDSKEQATEMNDQKLENKDEKEADRVVEAYSGNLYEIRCAENAGTRALTKDVQKLAGQIVTAHTKMNTDIEALAAKKNITLPTALGEDHQKKLADLVEKKGIDYDKEFLSIMKDKHEDSEKMYQRLSENSEDPEIKAWAASVLPEIRSHLDMVKNTKDVVDKVKDPNKDRNTINNDWDGDKSKLHDGRPNIPNEGKK
jgi:putative membrane protein